MIPMHHQASPSSQVHYTQLRPPGDQSGVRLKLTDDVLPFSAGMMMYASFFQIPPRVDSHLVPTRCCYSGFEPAHGFAYRVHTHALGRCGPPFRAVPTILLQRREKSECCHTNMPDSVELPQ